MKLVQAYHYMRSDRQIAILVTLFGLSPRESYLQLYAGCPVPDQFEPVEMSLELMVDAGSLVACVRGNPVGENALANILAMAVQAEQLQPIVMRLALEAEMNQEE